MNKLAVLAAIIAVSLIGASPAFAAACPKEAAAVEAALGKDTKLSAADKDAVKKLHAQGVSEHAAGKHAESMATLAKAKKMLGI
jgi:uncharacterized protein